jgi:hypothetical protein
VLQAPRTASRWPWTLAVEDRGLTELATEGNLGTPRRASSRLRSAVCRRDGRWRRPELVSLDGAAGRLIGQGRSAAPVLLVLAAGRFGRWVGWWLS